jgi:hypothetical protein
MAIPNLVLQFVILVYIWTIKVLRNFSAAFVAALVIKLSKLIFNLVDEQRMLAHVFVSSF